MSSLKSFLAIIFIIGSFFGLKAQNIVGEKAKITMLNGDTLTVKILSKDDNSISFLHPHNQSRRRIQLSQIKNIESIEVKNKPTKTEYVRLILKTNDTLFVKLISKDSNMVVAQNVKNKTKLTIFTKEIAQIEPIYSEEELPKEDFSKAQHSYSRNNISPTAIPLKAGEGYYHNIMVGYNNVHYAITNQLSIGIGTELFTSLGAEQVTWGINAKFAGKIANKWYLGVDAFRMNLTPFDDDKTWGALALVTHGTIQNNMTFSFGFVGAKQYGYTSTGQFVEKFRTNPIFSLSGQIHISGKTYLVNDLAIILGDENSSFVEINAGVIINPAVRIKFKKGALDLSLFGFGASGGGGFFPIPIVGYMANFGGKNK